MADFPPAVQWTLGIIAGGGTAAVVKAASGAVRIGSTSVSGGFTNWIVATAEHIASFVMSILSFIIPLVTGIAALLVLTFSIYKIFKWRKRKRAAPANV
jgi:hypothetical protein